MDARYLCQSVTSSRYVANGQVSTMETVVTLTPASDQPQFSASRSNVVELAFLGPEAASLFEPGVNYIISVEVDGG